jgi:hypothetical protein
MPYRFATERQNYADYASGRVFYGLPGQPAFPIRLASEVWQRCTAVLEAEGNTGPYVLYDPCCGGAYLLGTLAYLHWHAIAEVIASDIDERALSLAERNLALLTVDGIEGRIAEIAQMLRVYGKASHAKALKSAQDLRNRLLQLSKARPVKTLLFRADVTNSAELCEKLRGKAIDVVFADIPYGQRSDWRTGDDPQASVSSPVWQMMEALLCVVTPGTVLAVAADKRPKIAHEGYQRIERFRLGKRQVILLRPLC